MSRIPYPNPAELPDHIRNAVEIAPINVMRMLAGASPAVFAGFGQFAGAFYGASKLTANLREVAVLRVGYLCESRYEIYQHEEMARHAGLSEAQIAAIKKGGPHPGVLSEIQQVVLDFTDEVVTNVRASDASLAAVRKHLPDQTVLDLILVIGLYMAVSRFLETTGVELDTSALAWKSVDGLPRND